MSEVEQELPDGFPDALTALLSRNTGGSAPDIDDFQSSVDDSDYSEADWIEALMTFDEWLSEQKIPQRPISLMLGYIRCCAMQNAPNISLPKLNILVYQSLTEFGFDAGNSSQI